MSNFKKGLWWTDQITVKVDDVVLFANNILVRVYGDFLLLVANVSKVLIYDRNAIFMAWLFQQCWWPTSISNN